MAVKEVASLSELKKLIEAGNSIALDFYATWCGPCRAVGPKFQEFSEKHTSVSFLKIDVDKSRDAAEEFAIKTLPTFVFFAGGREVLRHSTSDPRPLEEAIKQLC